MEILLNPNVAYLALVLALVLAIMAILIPGTGLIEVITLFAWIAAGYSIYHLPVNYLALGVLVLGVIPFFIAVRRSGRSIYLILSILALVLGSIFFFQGEAWWKPTVNPFLAILISPLTAVFLWITARKGLEANLTPPAHDLHSLIGKVGEATTDILDAGSVQMAGELWSARSKQLIRAGSEVKVVSRDGLVLLVEKV